MNNLKKMRAWIRPSDNKDRRRDKNDVGENFIAPDGGWGWLVCIAAGVSNLSLYPCLLQFGFIFREHFQMIGFVSSEITTIVNTNSAISACTGLLNGPMFRRFSFRQVAIMGSLMVFCGLFLTAFCGTFACYIINDAVLYGFGMGISVSASSLAINTYFKKKRAKASGWAWTITGLGPIILPHVVTYLVVSYGVQGTILILSAFSLHSLVSALIYQPVHHHTKQRANFEELHMNEENNQESISKADLGTSMKMSAPNSVMLARSNDNWYNENNDKTLAAKNDEAATDNELAGMKDTPKKSCLQKFVTFFDLDLLRDPSYINLVMGLTIINFGELNFAILLPFILNEFGLATSQITLLMSTLASMDITVRFFGPFFTTKIPWDNRVFFLIGVGGIAVGRSIIACHHSNISFMIGYFAMIGFFKGLRTIYWPLIIPGCVPLKRLPAASGLQLLISGLFTFAGGPFVGLIRDRYNYAVTLHILNVMAFLGGFAWIIEALIKRCTTKTISTI